MKRSSSPSPTLMSARSVLLPVALVTLLASGCASTGEKTPKAEFDYTPYISGEVQQISSNFVSGWEEAGDNRVVMHLSPNRAYLLTLFGPCFHLDFSHRIAFTSDGTNIRSGIDSIYTDYDRERCRIQRIQSLDMKRLKADREKAKQTPTQPAAGDSKPAEG